MDISNNFLTQWGHQQQLTPNEWTYTMPISFISWGTLVATEANITTNAKKSVLSGCLINLQQFNICSNMTDVPFYWICLGA